MVQKKHSFKRISNVIKEFNIEIQNVVEYLQQEGFEGIEALPKNHITDEQYELLRKKFCPDNGQGDKNTYPNQEDAWAFLLYLQ